LDRFARCWVFCFRIFPVCQSFFDDVFLAKMSLLFFCLSTEIYGTNTDDNSFFFIILQKISSLISLNRDVWRGKVFLFFSEGRHRTINDETNEIVFVFLIFFFFHTSRQFDEFFFFLFFVLNGGDDLQGWHLKETWLNFSEIHRQQKINTNPNKHSRLSIVFRV